MKNESQQIAMYVALGAAITMLVLYFSGQLKFVEYLEGVRPMSPTMKVNLTKKGWMVNLFPWVSPTLNPNPTPTTKEKNKDRYSNISQ